MTRTALYRHFDADGALLYVGITDCLPERDKHHTATSSWHGQVHKTETQWCLSRGHALALERVAIQYEGPAHNKAGSITCDNDQQPEQPFREAIADFVSIWGSRAAMAKAIGVGETTIHNWFARGSIPSKYDEDLIRSAKMLGAEVTPFDILRLRAALKLRTSKTEGAA